MITIGMTGTASRKVEEKDLACHVRSGSLPVLATPILSAVMEEAACAAVRDGLEEGDTTVGGSITVIHKAPTLEGRTVTAEAKVTAAEGKKITFTITVRDPFGEIGTADHVRFLVNEKKFMERAHGRETKE